MQSVPLNLKSVIKLFLAIITPQDEQHDQMSQVRLINFQQEELIIYHTSIDAALSVIKSPAILDEVKTENCRIQIQREWSILFWIHKPKK